MKQINEIPAFKTRLNETRRSRLLRRMAYALSVTFCIPPHDEKLVFILGNGTEPNNLEALQTWVNQTVDTLEEQQATLMLDRLITELERKLNKKELDRCNF